MRIKSDRWFEESSRARTHASGTTSSAIRKWWNYWASGRAPSHQTTTISMKLLIWLLAHGLVSCRPSFVALFVFQSEMPRIHLYPLDNEIPECEAFLDIGFLFRWIIKCQWMRVLVSCLIETRKFWTENPWAQRFVLFSFSWTFWEIGSSKS